MEYISFKTSKALIQWATLNHGGQGHILYAISSMGSLDLHPDFLEWGADQLLDVIEDEDLPVAIETSIRALIKRILNH